MAVKIEGQNRKRSNRITFYLSDEELDLLNKKYEKTKYTSKSDYIRELILNGIIVIKDYKYLDGVEHELNKIGTNINQIAKFANTNGGLYKRQIDSLTEEMDRVWEIILKKI